MRTRNIEITVSLNFLKIEIIFEMVLMEKTVVSLLMALLFSSFEGLDFSTLLVF